MCVTRPNATRSHVSNRQDHFGLTPQAGSGGDLHADVVSGRAEPQTDKRAKQSQRSQTQSRRPTSAQSSPVQPLCISALSAFLQKRVGYLFAAALLVPLSTSRLHFGIDQRRQRVQRYLYLYLGWKQFHISISENRKPGLTHLLGITSPQTRNDEAQEGGQVPTQGWKKAEQNIGAYRC